MDETSLFAGGLGLAVALFLFLLALLWFLLPFAVFGIKDLLKDLIRETRATREILQAVRAELAAGRSQAAPPPVPGPPRAPASTPGGRIEPTFGEIIAHDQGG